MAPFNQSGSSKYHGYMNQLIHKIHEAEEMLLSGDDRHLEELKEIVEMIQQYINESQGHKFEPAQYRNLQGKPQGQQAFYDYPEMPRRGSEPRAHIGYVPYPYYPQYPFYNERGGSRQGEGYNNEPYDRRR